MQSTGLLIGALLPLVTLFGVLFIVQRSVRVAAAWAAVVTGVVALFQWQMTTAALQAAAIKSLLLTLEIGFLLLAAVLLLNFLKQTGVMTTITSLMWTISPDSRIQTILLSVFLVGIIEGLAGFGAPAMVVAPLLVGIGIPALTAVSLTLIGNSLTVPYGAVGTPFNIGLRQGLAELDPASYSAALQTPTVVSLLQTPLIVITPLLISCLLCYWTGHSWKKGLAVWKFALLSGMLLAAIQASITLWFGPDFPSLLGSLLSGGVLIAAARSKRLKPTHTWKVHATTPQYTSKPVAHTQWIILSYLAVLIGLLASRLPQLPLQAWLTETGQVTIASWQHIPLHHSFSPLYSPAFFLILGTSLALLAAGGRAQPHTLLSSSLRQLSRPLLTISTLLLLTQILLFSGYNATQLPSIPLYLATWTSALPINWLFLAPVLGAFGSTMTGSVTVSNLLFAHFQAQSALSAQLDMNLALGLQVVGAAVGNMTSLQNIIAAVAVVGLSNSELKVFKRQLNIAVLFVAVLLLWGVLVSRV